MVEFVKRIIRELDEFNQLQRLTERDLRDLGIRKVGESFYRL